MKALLEALERRARTMTVYGFEGSEADRQALSDWLGGFGIALSTAPASAGPAETAVLTRDGDRLGTVAVEDLLARMRFETALAPDAEAPEIDLLSSLSPEVAVQPARTVQEMVRVSREFERRALRKGAGELHAGFQQLSRLTDSDRTMRVYGELPQRGVAVTVYGYPDVTLEDPPFTVVEDDEGALTRHWFLLYDGGGDPARTAALVSRECLPADATEAETTVSGPGTTDPTVLADRLAGEYDSYFTTDADAVAELFELARRDYPDLMMAPAED